MVSDVELRINLARIEKESMMLKILRQCVGPWIAGSPGVGFPNTIHRVVALTRFFRNPPLLRLLARLVADSKQRPVRIGSYGVADGSELISLLIALDPVRTHLELELEGFDINTEFLALAMAGTCLTAKHCPQGFEPALFPDYLEPRPDGTGWRVKPSHQTLFRYAYGDVLAPPASDCMNRFDLLMCLNVVGSFTPELCRQAVVYLVARVKPGGIVALGGENLDMVPKVCAAAGLIPILEDVAAIHNAWTVQRAFYDKGGDRPWWALEPFNANHPDGITRYCAVYRKPETTMAASGDNLAGTNTANTNAPMNAHTSDANT